MNTLYSDSPAFPVPGMPPIGTGDPRDGMAGGCDPMPGLTVRQQFAAMAMQGLLSNLGAIRREGFKDSEIPLFAVMQADALIKELNK